MKNKLKHFISTNNRLLKTIFLIVVVLAVAYFLYVSLRTSWLKVEDLSLELSSVTTLAMLCFLGGVVAMGVGWGGILNALSTKKIKPLVAVRLQLASWLLKYIPSQAGSVINRVAWGVKENYSKKTLAISIIYENVLLVAVSTVVPVAILGVLLGENLQNVGSARFLPVLAAIPLLLLFNPKIFAWGTNQALKLAKKDPITSEYFLNFKQLIMLSTSYLFSRALNGIGFAFIATTLINPGLSSLIELGAIYVLASIVGMLTIFVPSGIGVREAVIVILASTYVGIPASQATALALLARFYATAADLFIAVLYLGLKKTNN